MPGKDGRHPHGNMWSMVLWWHHVVNGAVVTPCSQWCCGDTTWLMVLWWHHGITNRTIYGMITVNIELIHSQLHLINTSSPFACFSFTRKSLKNVQAEFFEQNMVHGLEKWANSVREKTIWFCPGSTYMSTMVDKKLESKMAFVRQNQDGLFQS